MSSLIILLWLLTQIMNISNHPSKQSFGFNILAKYSMLEIVAYLTSLFLSPFEVLHDTRVYYTLWIIIFLDYTSKIYYWLHLFQPLLDRCHEAEIITSVYPVRVWSIIILLLMARWAYVLIASRLAVFAYFKKISNKTWYTYLHFLSNQKKRCRLAKLLPFANRVCSFYTKLIGLFAYEYLLLNFLEVREYFCDVNLFL